MLVLSMWAQYAGFMLMLSLTLTLSLLAAPEGPPAATAHLTAKIDAVLETPEGQ